MPPEQVVQQQLDAYNSRDIDAWLATYAADAEQYLLHGEPLASGIEAIRARMQDRFADPALHADLVSRTVMDNIVVDHEFVTRTFPEGVGRIEMICIYEVHAGRIRKATFAIGQAVGVDQCAKRMRSIDEQITLRPALATDTHAARAIHHRAVRDVVMRQFGAWDEAVQDGFFDNAWHPERFEIVECSGKPCGYFRREYHQTYIEIHEINIDPAYQGQGIGTRILMDALADADQLGLPVVLQTLHLNRAADLYQRLGFGEVGRTATHIQMQRDYRPTRL